MSLNHAKYQDFPEMITKNACSRLMNPPKHTIKEHWALNSHSRVNNHSKFTPTDNAVPNLRCFPLNFSLHLFWNTICYNETVKLSKKYHKTNSSVYIHEAESNAINVKLRKPISSIRRKTPATSARFLYAGWGLCTPV